MCMLLKLEYAKFGVSNLFLSKVIEKKPLAGSSRPPGKGRVIIFCSSRIITGLRKSDITAKNGIERSQHQSKSIKFVTSLEGQTRTYQLQLLISIDRNSVSEGKCMILCN